MIIKIEIGRFTVTSSKPFDIVVAGIKASVGHPNMASLWQAVQRATTSTELDAANRYDQSHPANQPHKGVDLVRNSRPVGTEILL